MTGPPPWPGGSFQLYAYAMDFVVSRTRMERTEAILSWGRSRIRASRSLSHPSLHSVLASTSMEKHGKNVMTGV
jgi:hypothetical protein